MSESKNELLYSQYAREPASVTIPSSSAALDLAGPSCAPQYPGIFPAALLLTFRLISELRQRRPDFHYSIRISALYYSQRRNLLIDLLASFILPINSQDVTIREDSVLGIKIENHSELRVDSVEQAMLMIDDIIQARLTGNFCTSFKFKKKKNISTYNISKLLGSNLFLLDF
uniref:Kinesin motor domain-containing protein n=1 Tax=Elaeophora elaphi TaxID=1147741 RepID=A0A0R3RNK4_9BILA